LLQLGLAKALVEGERTKSDNRQLKIRDCEKMALILRPPYICSELANETIRVFKAKKVLPLVVVKKSPQARCLLLRGLALIK
jgi:hypothetical protein